MLRKTSIWLLVLVLSVLWYHFYVTVFPYQFVQQWHQLLVLPVRVVHFDEACDSVRNGRHSERHVHLVSDVWHQPWPHHISSNGCMFEFSLAVHERIAIQMNVCIIAGTSSQGTYTDKRANTQTQEKQTKA